MVIVRLIGGLGNQFFQYAAGRALAHHHEVPLRLDISAFEAYPLRKYRLDKFNISAAIASPVLVKIWAVSGLTPSWTS